MLKILHTADLHLDSPFSSLSAAQAASRRERLRGVFTSMTTYARTEGIDLFLIAGDLFDAEFVTRDTMELLRSEFAKIPDTLVAIAPGNHDPYAPGSVWTKLGMPDNVRVFDAESLKRIALPAKNADVYGYAFTSNSLRANPVIGRCVADASKINVLVGHAVIDDPLSEYAPVSRAQLAAFGADYAALGHVHNAEGLHGKEGGCVFAYSGCPEGRSFDECGRKYALVVSIDKSGGEAAVSVGKKEFSLCRYECVTVDVTGAQSAADVREAVRSPIAKAGCDKNTALRLRLIGQTARPIAAEGLREAIAVGSLEIRDETLPLWNSGLESDQTLRGEFYRAIKPRLESADEREREVALRALKYALSAMAGEDIPE